jgi:hypothetical protein
MNNTNKNNRWYIPFIVSFLLATVIYFLGLFDGRAQVYREAIELGYVEYKIDSKIGKAKFYWIKPENIKK